MVIISGFELRTTRRSTNQDLGCLTLRTSLFFDSINKYYFHINTTFIIDIFYYYKIYMWVKKNI